ncbi:MAG: peptide deformylase [Prolixibacteraceae bacterium]|jgi:peptide deformylase|nr:peptide deformylase [Prolixibacteraceae bacterium]
MILPVTVYGDPKLRKVTQAITKDYEGLSELIDNMFETMYNAEGVGLAAPQIGLTIRLFIVDGSPAAEDEPELKDFKKVFINPEIIEVDGEPWEMEEGCLSLPSIREKVMREEQVTIKYFDENWKEITETYNGFAGRIILHEYDHLEGKLFIDYISPLRKRLLKSKLTAITKGKGNAAYRTMIPG